MGFNNLIVVFFRPIRSSMYLPLTLVCRFQGTNGNNEKIHTEETRSIKSESTEYGNDLPYFVIYVHPIVTDRITIVGAFTNDVRDRNGGGVGRDGGRIRTSRVLFPLRHQYRVPGSWNLIIDGSRRTDRTVSMFFCRILVHFFTLRVDRGEVRRTQSLNGKVRFFRNRDSVPESSPVDRRKG